MLPTLLLFAVVPAELGVARLELTGGRADIASAAGVTSLVGRSGAQLVEGPAYVELGAASQLALRWRGEASLELRGVAAVEWRAPVDSRGVLFTAWRVSELDFEVRRGPLRLDVGGGWRLELDVGAAGLRTLADGRIEVRHVAGAPLRIARDLGAGLVTPPWTLLPGGEVRLEAGAMDSGASRDAGSGPEFRGRALQPPAPGRERFAPSEPWAQFAWPWAAPARPAPWPAHSTNERPEAAAPARIESGRIAPASSSVDARLESGDTASGAASSDSLELPRFRSSPHDASAPATGAAAQPQNPQDCVAPSAPVEEDEADLWRDSTSPRELTPEAASEAPRDSAAPVGAQAPSALEPTTSNAEHAGPAQVGDDAVEDSEVWRAVRLAAHFGLLVQRAAPHTCAERGPAAAPLAPRKPFDASRFTPLRRTGVLVPTPFGPRWSERP